MEQCSVQQIKKQVLKLKNCPTKRAQMKWEVKGAKKRKIAEHNKDNTPPPLLLVAQKRGTDCIMNLER